MSCVWQFDGQWCMMTDHVSADAGSEPSCGSLALPLNAIAVPTLQVNDDSGDAIVAVGAVLFTDDDDGRHVGETLTVGDAQADGDRALPCHT